MLSVVALIVSEWRQANMEHITIRKTIRMQNEPGTLSCVISKKLQAASMHSKPFFTFSDKIDINPSGSSSVI